MPPPTALGFLACPSVKQLLFKELTCSLFFYCTGDLERKPPILNTQNDDFATPFSVVKGRELISPRFSLLVFLSRHFHTPTLSPQGTKLVGLISWSPQTFSFYVRSLAEVPPSFRPLYTSRSAPSHSPYLFRPKPLLFFVCRFWGNLPTRIAPYVAESTPPRNLMRTSLPSRDFPSFFISPETLVSPDNVAIRITLLHSIRCPRACCLLFKCFCFRPGTLIGLPVGTSGAHVLAHKAPLSSNSWFANTLKLSP